MRNIKPKTDDYMLGGSGPMKPKKSEPRYPTIRIDLEHIPEAKDWKVGKSYGIEMVVKMVGISQSRFDNSAEFEIRKIGVEDAKEAEDEEKEEGEEEDGDESNESDHG